MAFYTYKDSTYGDGANPKCTGTSGHTSPDQVVREGQSLDNIDVFKEKGGYIIGATTDFDHFRKMMIDLVDMPKKLKEMKDAGKLPPDIEKIFDKFFPQAAQVQNTMPRGASLTAASLTSASLTAAADLADDDVIDTGTFEYDGIVVTYTAIYFDSDGTLRSEPPMMPGNYVGYVSFTSPEIEAGTHEPITSLVVPITIEKKRIAKPTPKELEFACANWETGEGELQDAFDGLDDAFEDLDDADFEFVSGEVAGITSERAAKAAGDYQACFRLKDTSTCAWEGEADGTSEVWVPWSIKSAGFDPNDPEITYWGTAYDNNNTSVTYAGEPIWVRPWFTPTKDTDGKFPEWFIHWTSEDRPASDRRSSCVVYLNGDNDYEGLIGYHENVDGSLEPVTAEQVYVWANGVDIEGKHVTVKSGQKVWYKTDKDGGKTPLAVQETQPEGADGYVVARDYAWADRLGVMEPGTYRAYALFDERAGFAATSLAETTVTVGKAENPMTAKGRAFSAPVGKKTVYAKTTAFKLSKAKGAVTFKKISGSKKITVNKKTGAVTVKKGLKKGKTYKVKVKVTAAGGKNYKKASKTITLKVKIA